MLIVELITVTSLRRHHTVNGPSAQPCMFSTNNNSFFPQRPLTFWFV